MDLDISTEHWILKDNGAFSQNFGANNFQGELLYLAKLRIKYKESLQFWISKILLSNHSPRM